MRRQCIFLLALLTVGCGWTPADEQVLRIFFEQSQIYDTTRVATVASVVFDPRVEGIVERFWIVDRSDKPLSDDRLERQARLDVRVRSAGRAYERTLLVTMERDGHGRWMIRRFSWVSQKAPPQLPR